MISSLATRVLVMCQGEQVEYGTAEQIFAAPGHDYTRMLLDSIPQIDDDLPADEVSL